MWNRDGEDQTSEPHCGKLFMIMVSSDSKKSFESINKWTQLIRKDFAKEPVYLVLNVKDTGGAVEVNEPMLQENCFQSSDGITGLIVINNKGMSHTELCGILD